MSEIARWDLWDGQMSQSVSGLWVRYAAHEFEVERLAAELAEAHERCRALELAVEQADEMKAHAEASAAAEEAETDRVTAERDAAQAEVERLKAGMARLKADPTTELGKAYYEIGQLRTELAEQDRKLETAQAEVERLTVERDKAQAGDDVALSALTSALRERDAAQAEVERLTQELDGRRATNQRVIAERDAARANSIEDARLKNDIISRLVKQRDAMQAEIKRLRANGQAMLDTSRPTDEDIWREGFMRCLNDVAAEDWQAQADLALAEYRKRWPR